MRQFIRHPTDIPISLVKSAQSQQKDSALDSAGEDEQAKLLNISQGGLACTTARPFAVGEHIRASIRIRDQSYAVFVQVMWCHYDDLGYEVGLRFLNAEDAFTTRMVEQICHIEHYKREVYITEGRVLTAEQAAAEWITQFAKSFPDTTESDHD